MLRWSLSILLTVAGILAALVGADGFANAQLFAGGRGCAWCSPVRIDRPMPLDAPVIWGIGAVAVWAAALVAYRRWLRNGPEAARYEPRFWLGPLAAFLVFLPGAWMRAWGVILF